MLKLKKFRIFLSYLLLCYPMISCSGDDDSSSEPESLTETQLIGQWNLREKNVGTDTETTLEFCELLSSLTFLETNAIDVDSYVGDDAEDCDFASISGTWVISNEDINELEINLNGIGITRVMATVSNNGNRLVIETGEGQDYVRERYEKQ